MRTCTKCEVIKPISEFGKKSSNLDGIHSWCKTCNRSAAVAWQSANPDKHNAATSKWAAANREKARASVSKWYTANKDKCAERIAKWASDNQEARRINEQNRRARKRESSGKLSKNLADKLLKIQRGKCACCAKPLGEDYHLDHIVPLALGGHNTDDNIQLLHAKCNLQKSAKHPIDFMQQKGFLL